MSSLSQERRSGGPEGSEPPKRPHLLQEEGFVITAKAPAGTRWWEQPLAGFGPTLLFVGLWYWLMTKSAAGAGGIFSCGKAKPKQYAPTNEHVTLADVDGAKEELAEGVDFLRNPDKYRKLGAHIPRGTLLSGQPGTGKTLAAEANGPLFSMSASEFVEMIVGAGASRVDKKLEVGDAVRWVGPGVWRVEEVAGDRVTLRLWPDNEPYPDRINEVGPGEWPNRAA